MFRKRMTKNLSIIDWIFLPDVNNRAEERDRKKIFSLEEKQESKNIDEKWFLSKASFISYEKDKNRTNGEKKNLIKEKDLYFYSFRSLIDDNDLIDIGHATIRFKEIFSSILDEDFFLKQKKTFGC